MNSETIKLDKDLAFLVNRLTFLGNNLEERVNVHLAIGLFTEKQVSLAKAAALVNKSIQEFMEILKTLGIPWCEYDEEMKKTDDHAISLIIRESEI